MKDFFSTAKFKILVALAVVLAGMMAWAGANNRLTSAPQELLGAAAVPFQKIGALLSEGVSGVVTKYAEYDSIVEENEQLKQENYDLRQQLVDYDKLKAENEAFRDLNNIREQNPEFEYASAFVIGRDPLDQFGGFTVDAGTLDNVKKGDVVVSDKGYLVGIVLEPGLTSSKVLTILSPSLNAAGVVSRTRDNGILTGDSAYSGDGLTTFTGLPRDRPGRGVPGGHSGGHRAGAGARSQRQNHRGGGEARRGHSHPEARSDHHQPVTAAAEAGPPGFGCT